MAMVIFGRYYGLSDCTSEKNERDIWVSFQAKEKYLTDKDFLWPNMQISKENTYSAPLLYRSPAIVLTFSVKGLIFYRTSFIIQFDSDCAFLKSNRNLFIKNENKS